MFCSFLIMTIFAVKIDLGNPWLNKNSVAVRTLDSIMHKQLIS